MKRTKWRSNVNWYPKDLTDYWIRLFGEREAKRLIEALREPGSRYYLRVNTLKISVEKLLQIFRSKGFKVYQDDNISEAIYIKIEGPFEVPLESKHVIADKFASESVYVGANLYAPGILKADADIRPGDKVTILSPLKEPIAWGVACMSGYEMRHRKRGLSVKVLRSRYRVPSLRNLEEYARGYFYEQSLPAMIASVVLDPKPDDVIVDMCAAPGGKTTHIAQLMRNEGIIYAFEKSKRKAQQLRENLRRLGITNVEVIVHDSRYIHIDFPEIKPDKIMLDPPCSALGVRPKLYENKTLRDVIAAMEYQRQFLKAAAKKIRPGGTILYSTCTMTLEENELNVKYAVERLGLKLVEQPLFIGSPGIMFNKLNGIQRFYPHIHDTPGYFIALLIKD